MQDISGISRTIWIRTDRSVVPTKTADWHHLLEVQTALQRGVFAVADSKRPEFFEIKIEESWYYIHIPSRIAGVYIIAAAKLAYEATAVEAVCDYARSCNSRGL